MTSGSVSWRVVVICTVRPLAEDLIGKLRDTRARARCPARAAGLQWLAAALVPGIDRPTAPAGIDLLFARDKYAIEPLLRAYEPDLMTCWGFPWKIPQAALDVPRLGSDQPAPGAAAAPPRPDSARLGAARRRRGVGPDVAPHGCRARHGNMLVQGTVPIEDDDVDIEEFGAKLRPARSICFRERWSGSRPAIPATHSRRRARAGQAISRTTTT